MTHAKLKKVNSGLFTPTFDPRDVFKDEIIPPVGGFLPPVFETKDIPYEPQGAKPWCTAMAVTGMVEEKLRRDGSDFQLSEADLFFNSGGTMKGNWFRSTLNFCVKKGVVNLELMPFPLNLWAWDSTEYGYLKQIASELPENQRVKVGGYARIRTDKKAIKEAIMEHGIVGVGIYAGGGYWNPHTKRQGSPDNHMTRLKGWDDNTNQWLVKESLVKKSNWDGEHRISMDYAIYNAFVVLDLDPNWKEAVKKKRSEGFQNALNHYGKPRVIELEIKAASELIRAFNKFSNQAVLNSTGPRWTVLINAAAYGGYSITYRKWGREWPGDILNNEWKRFKTGTEIFNYNETKS